VVVASAGPYANHLHLATERQPLQHLTTNHLLLSGININTVNSIESTKPLGCKPAYLVPVPSQDKLGGLWQEGHLA